MKPILLTLTLITGSALLPGAPLQPGDVLPVVQGKTLNNRQTDLPQALGGKPGVVAFGFSKDAGNPIRDWAGRIASEAPVYQVPVLEGVPRLFRGLAEGSIRKDTDAKNRDNVVLLYREEKLWRERLAVADDKAAHVVVVDGSGRVLDRLSGPPSEEAVARVRAALARAAR